MNNLNLHNIQIKSIEIYYPEHTVTVDDIIKTNDPELQDELEMEAKIIFGKNILHQVPGPEENTLTMSVIAAKKALVSAGLEGKDIDMVCLASMLPEYLSPPTSALIHQEIGGRQDAICYDINANCCGMLFSFYQIAAQMNSDKRLKHVLLIGSDVNSVHVGNEYPLIPALMGDAACAIVLEQTTCDSGMIDYRQFVVHAHDTNSTSFPICGTSNIYHASVEARKSKIFPSVPIDIPVTANMITQILSDNQLTLDDIALFCFSQYSLFTIKMLQKKLSIPEEKSIYHADKLGYNGVVCTFLSLYQAIKQNKIKRGDYIFFWTYGAGVQIIYALIKY